MNIDENPEVETSAEAVSEETPSETTVEATPEEPSQEGAPPAPKCSWEQREGFKIANTMRDLIHQTIDASTSEIDSLRKKLEKLQYGG